MNTVTITQLRKQIDVASLYTKPTGDVRKSFVETVKLIKMFLDYQQGNMDKKMHKVTEKMKVAVKDIKEGKKKSAVKTLKKAEKKNEKLVKIDRDVRDPMIKKCKMMMKKKAK